MSNENYEFDTLEEAKGMIGYVVYNFDNNHCFTYNSYFRIIVFIK